MNIFLDTATSDFVLILFDNNFQVHDFFILENFKKKVDYIPEYFETFLSKNNLKVNDLSGLYTNLGPGFFTGARTSLVYLRTIAMALNLPLYFTNSFSILMKQNFNQKLYLDAQGNKLYEFDVQNKKPNQTNVLVISKENQKIDQIDYHQMVVNFKDYQDVFETSELLKIEPLYIKKPQIGGA
ncbi:tRNA (adenosine(37)-N6)-threonylcarbamoyltransferase complex dimerization subunit type 1 TsaB [Mycoplasmopsis gallopavonis]|uniref:Molecular chaperone n=1 Tax=Mycoplasmopsis gallopavonis TaxID=76629 RepID=A0A449AYF5_9BACT|nr:tRNA (adenosine(37)-N6)-threonylcarbamoyltransferase complex dimerization subunit type 1 TsaB [Mycoplasmopsis gallopavonis]RIV16743.1 tRNA (adenosine(37)-N6)-threonylcarbamoyltransferase complex dimerization subunit type 1 TsaB [Mycoplasmopsis gallopavonis]VEU72569.1 molecular chaperone [Mycoplasmopsis gallopavonis]